MFVRSSGVVVVVVAAVAYYARRERVFARSELAAFDGVERKEIYMAIMGKVFDVTTGSKFYAKGKSYAFYAGTDGSLSFVTGDFKNNITDNVSSLTPTELYNLLTWVNGTYYSKYIYKGKLEGYFYDRRGHPTPEMRSIEQLVAQEREDMKKREHDEVMYPKCSARRSRTEHRVWCADPLVPRRRSVFGGKERCACVALDQASAAAADFGPYPDCPPSNSSCNRI
ncbi:hypothetical protein CTAYLR_005424 [Chrysophaeum taylorii]|uniref:Cytochrome b5 heme-binding domain-containing protein n=1 Tax=Chrysophaeum taylorii TaxID=2483200 RepID=A0AAD7U7E1_9STRA|nr:hypothetical protein CTAYLR_005424 [Chrysophaeum taylorii]